MTHEPEQSSGEDLSDRDLRLEAEARRVYLRYAVEIVEKLSFCPYAERCRLDGRTREVVLAESRPTDSVVLDAIESTAKDGMIEIGLLIFPRLEIGRVELGRWVEVLRKKHNSNNHGKTVLAVEGFHPVAEADLGGPALLTPFVRRSPDPTMQLTRLSVLERVRRSSPSGTGFFDPAKDDFAELLKSLEKRPLHERIASLNLETVERLGVADVGALMEDILADRDRSYREIDPAIPLRLG